MRWGAWLWGVLGALLIAAPAQAGTYVVRACNTPAGFFPNLSWSAGVDRYFNGRGTCSKPPDDVATEIWPNGAAIPPGTARAMTFTAPAGASIADFRIERSLFFYNPTVPEAPRSPYILFSLGATPFSGAGDAPESGAVNAAAPSQWYGYPAQAAELSQGWAALRDFPALRGYRGGAATLSIAIGCAAGGSACSLRQDGWVTARLFGAEVTVDDPRRPVITAMAPDAGGATFSATDNAGIAAATLLDVTDAAAPRVVATREYRSARSATGETCNAARPAPCPTALRDERLDGAVGGGRRTLALRVTDAGGNVTESAPGVVQVGSPATSCVPGGPAIRARTRTRPLRYGRAAGVRGRVVSGGSPVAGAAVQAYTRVRRSRAAWLPGATATTRANGRFRLRLRPGASRAVRVVLVEPAAVRCSRTLRLRVRAGVALRVKDAAIPRGGRARFTGRLRGGPARGSRLVIVQAFDGGRWRTFATARTRRDGRWAGSYRFSGGAAGSYRFRARVRPQAGYPYATGTSRVRTVRVG